MVKRLEESWLTPDEFETSWLKKGVSSFALNESGTNSRTQDNSFYDLVADISYSHVLVLIHGASSSGQWKRILSHYSDESRSPIFVDGVYYDAKNIIGVLINPHPKHEIADLYRQLRSALDKFPNAKISISCHSWGGIVLSKCLIENSDLTRFDKLFLMGSIIPQHDIRKIKSRFSCIICDISQGDFLSCLAQAIRPSFLEARSATGYDEFDLAINRIFPGGHSSKNDEAHYLQWVFPSITGEIRMPRRIASPLLYPSQIIFAVRFTFFICAFFILLLIYFVMIGATVP